MKIELTVVGAFLVLIGFITLIVILSRMDVWSERRIRAAVCFGLLTTVPGTVISMVSLMI